MDIKDNPGDDEIRALLQRVKRIAVVGLSPKPHRDSHRVSAYMQRAGYEIVPVYPREDAILGARVYRSVGEIEEPVDLVNVFRRAEDLPLLQLAQRQDHQQRSERFDVLAVLGVRPDLERRPTATQTTHAVQPVQLETTNNSPQGHDQ